MKMAPEQFGPVYPELAGMAKHRKAARNGLSAMPRAERQAYGLAVETAIRAKQRAELQRVFTSHNCSCASGTNHNDGAAIHKAMQAKQRAALLAAPSAERRARKPAEWRRLYDAAMADKRKREAQELERWREAMPLAA
jgi:hypothetical protein